MLISAENAEFEGATWQDTALAGTVEVCAWYKESVRTGQASAVKRVGGTRDRDVFGWIRDIAASVYSGDCVDWLLSARLCAQWPNATLHNSRDHWCRCNRLGFLVRLIGVARDATRAAHPQTLP